MDKVRILDKEFSVTIPSERIQARIRELGKQMDSDLAGHRPVFVVVLNGAFLFAADMMKNIATECEVAFVRVSSYKGTQSTGQIRNHIGISEELKDRTVVVVEDIVDSGDTAFYLLEEIKNFQPKEIRLACLLHKPKSLKRDIKIDYIGFEVPDDFLVGFGLDYHGLGRNLNDIYKIVE